MHAYPFDFTLLHSLEENTSPDIIFEIINVSDVEKLRDFSISEGIISCVRENFLLTGNDRESSLDILLPIFSAKRIIFFFPDWENIANSRGDFLRSRKRNFTYISFEKELSPTLESLLLSTYTFNTYKSSSKSISVSLYRTHTTDESVLADRLALLSRVYATRDIVNTPPSHTNPEYIVESLRAYPWKHTKVHIFEKSQLKKFGMNLLLAVGAGSPNHPYVVIFERIGSKNAPSYGIIGKGVTFDSWGIQLKPWEAMHDMKLDMSGAGAVIWLMQYLDGFPELPMTLIAGIGLVENMTGGNAYKPLDIYRAYNGKMVEIHHTDAEWRLLLADVMSYVEDIYHVDHLITIATLTGACMHALWYNYSGVMWDDEMVIWELMALSTNSEERVWRLPFNEHIGKSLKTDLADLRNIALEELAGASLGAAFLAHFRWKAQFTHLDIAGPAHRKTPYGWFPKGATWWGVMLLAEFFMKKRKWRKRRM